MHDGASGPESEGFGWPGGAGERPRPQAQHMERSYTGVRVLTGEEAADRCGGSVVERGEGRKKEPRDSTRNEGGLRLRISDFVLR